MTLAFYLFIIILFTGGADIQASGFTVIHVFIIILLVSLLARFVNPQILSTF